MAVIYFTFLTENIATHEKYLARYIASGCWGIIVIDTKGISEG